MCKTLFILLVFFSFGVSAQSGEGNLHMKGARIFLDDRVLKPKEVVNLLQVDPDAAAAYKKAKSNYDAAQVIGFVGGFMIGFPLGTAVGGGDPQWGIAAGGAGLLLLTLPLSSGYKKHARKAIEIYNGQSGSTARNYSIEFSPTATGAKLLVWF